ncbi:reverse transcriptase domain-containing protein [Wolbachia pipientis]|nr:reverse transcriptase domain-containing protein [Wolbachia pipientis]
MNKTKSFDMPKQLVWRAYKQVSKNKGAAGVDEVTITKFEENLKDNLYKLWNRMSSGSYFPEPVKAVAIPKGTGGGQRTLCVPSVSDRIAQTAATMYLEPLVEPIFHKDSYGYRPNKSALDAVYTARKRCWKNDWTIDLDISGFFDNLDHDLALQAIKKHTDCKWVILYVERWMKVPIQQADGNKVARDKGVPQGGSISPIISNIFMHHAKDDDRKEEYPIQSFDFLGYTFRPRIAKNKMRNYFVSFLPAICNKAKKKIKKTIKSWRIHRVTWTTLEEISKRIDPIVRGWFQYYGRFYKSEMYPSLRNIERYLIRWVRTKYKKLRDHGRLAKQFLGKVRKRSPNIFYHWTLGLGSKD